MAEHTAASQIRVGEVSRARARDVRAAQGVEEEGIIKCRVPTDELKEGQKENKTEVELKWSEDREEIQGKNARGTTNGYRRRGPRMCWGEKVQSVHDPSGCHD